MVIRGFGFVMIKYWCYTFDKILEKVFAYMSTKPDRSASSKPKPRTRSGPSRRKAPQINARPAPTALVREVKCLIMIAVGLLLLLSVFVPDAIGFVGRFLGSVFFGLFGFGAFALPVALIAVAVGTLVSRRLNPPMLLTISLFWLILAFLHIINSSDLVDYGIFARLGYAYSYGGPFSGGMVGAILGEFVFVFLGRVGSIVALGAAILILAVLLTRRSFVYLVAWSANFLGDAVNRAKDHYTRLPEDFDDDDEEYEIDEPVAPPPPPALVRRKKPGPAKEIKPGIFEIDDKDETVELPQVLLVQEELEGKGDKTPANVASHLFARRDIDRERAEVPLFPGNETDKTDEVGDALYMSADEPVVKGLVDIPDEYEYVYAPSEHEESKIVSFPEAAMPVVRARPTQTRAVSSTASSIAYEAMPSYEDYKFPSIDLLNEPPAVKSKAESRTQMLENSRILEETLRSFRIEVKVVEVSVGPTVTRYDLVPGPGVKVSSIANLSNDLALSLAAQGIRIEAPIPGKSAVGIEIPNKEPQPVYLREIIQEERFENYPSRLAFAVGKDIAGEPVVTDVARMPHLLIAGATGSGKSVCINTLITSLLYKARPDEVKLLMIDPKVVELSVYNGIPHLLIPVVTDPKKASGALSWAVGEMESRYNMFAETGCRDLRGFNLAKSKAGEAELPQIVIIIDELADLMMACKGEVEESICRLAQKARAAGIHLIVATQRPSVDVITGLIKANIPSRLAFAVSSGTDSRTVLDMYGAEKLLGKGDMLFSPMGNSKPVRIQGGLITDKEVEGLVSFLKAQSPPAEYTQEMIQEVTMPGKTKIEGEVDEFFHDAVDFLLSKGKASTSMLQRQFRIGYNRASRLMDELELRGIVGPEDGVKPRKVTITRDEYHEIYGED